MDKTGIRGSCESGNGYRWGLDVCGKCGSSAERLDIAGFIEVGFGSGSSFAMLE